MTAFHLVEKMPSNVPGVRRLVSIALVGLFALIRSSSSAASHCVREQDGIRLPKTPGDNGYRLKISGNQDKYVPGEVYTGIPRMRTAHSSRSGVAWRDCIISMISASMSLSEMLLFRVDIATSAYDATTQYRMTSGHSNRGQMEPCALLVSYLFIKSAVLNRNSTSSW